MTIRPDMEPLAKDLGCVPFHSDSVAKQFLGAFLYRKLLEIAIRERSSVVTVARDMLRQQVEA